MQTYRRPTWTMIGGLLLACMLAGGLTGIISSVITTQSLQEYLYELTKNEALLTTSQERPEPVPGTYREAVEYIHEHVWPSIGYVYPAIVIDAGEVAQSEWTAMCAAVTSDGWLICPGLPSDLEWNVYLEGELYDVTSLVRDAVTGAVMLRVNAAGLDVLEFADSNAVYSGEQIFALENDQQLQSLTVASTMSGLNDILQAEQDPTQWTFDELATSFTLLLNGSGDLLGVTMLDRVVEMAMLEPFIRSTLRNGEGQGVGVGAYVTYLDGLLTGEGALSGVRIESLLPEAPNELIPGDVLLAVNGSELDASFTLAQALRGYELEDTVFVTVLRSDVEQEIELSLVNLEDLVY